MRKAARREPADQLQQAATAPDTVEFERSDQVFNIQTGDCIELFRIALSAQCIKPIAYSSASVGCIRKETPVQRLVGSFEVAASVEGACAAVDAIR